MKKFLGIIAAFGMVLATSSSAFAQYGVNRNLITNSGNGAYNNIISRNINGYFGGGYNSNMIYGSGNGVGNRIIATNRGGFPGHFPGPVGRPGCGYPVQYGPGFPVYNPGRFGVNLNIITNSGNGIGNFIHAGN